MLISKKQEKPKKQKKLRNAEYYDMTSIFDDLYAQSKDNKVFTNLMELVSARENILLAYRNIKKNDGSMTAGVDRLTILNLSRIPEEKFVDIVKRKLAWYKPKPVRRVEIKKPNGKIRPLGIPAIWDRIVQQCILQILEPICEAKFYERSNGFRPNRSAEHAIAQCCHMIQSAGLHFVVDIDITGFFDNVNHCKLKQQIWEMGIRDKKLLCVISEMLKAPIIMLDGSKVYPDKGTPQGGILSPLLSNIVLNELDWWIDSQWEGMPTRHEYVAHHSKRGTANHASKNRALKTTTLKEMHIVRYADDFKIFCRKRSDADKVFKATTLWLWDRLRLNVSMEKSSVTNLKRRYSEFLGIKLKAVKKHNKFVVQSHMTDKAVEREIANLKNQIKRIKYANTPFSETVGINQYNAMVMGIHNYYRMATHISADCQKIGRQISQTMKNRLGKRLSRKGNPDGFNFILNRYGKSKQLRYIGNKPICPISFISTSNALWKKKEICKYTAEGRILIHKALELDMGILHKLMLSTEKGESVEYMDNRISLYAGQCGKCAITGVKLDFDDIRCHHKIPLEFGGTDKYSNLIILHVHVHFLVHATTSETINKYLKLVKPTSQQLEKINKLRTFVKNEPIA